MPPPIPVALVPPDARWEQRAVALAAQLAGVGPVVVTVHHIGSTAIPGICAKPIIDLMPVVTSLRRLDAVAERIRLLGYVWRGEYGIVGRRYCTMSDEHGGRIAHVHCFESDSPHIARHLAFRDYLRARPGVAGADESEKRRARDLHPNDSRSYTSEKARWVAATEADALAWVAQTRGVG